MVVVATLNQELPMFSSKKRPEQAQAIHTLLGKGTLWKGEVQAGQNSLRIEGTVEGNIQSEGEVTIAPTGMVRGTITAKHLIVTGRVEGTFKIHECLEIHGTGWVEGEVEVGSLVVDEGGTLQGHCIRRGHGTPEPAGKGEKTERIEKADKVEKTEKTEKPERVERPEKAERPDKIERPEREPGFVPFPAPAGMPSPVPAAAFAGGPARADDSANDRHVFNMSNGASPLPPAGEHAYSKTKL
jgi:cytoskeletal protein CcmA (bactofilin family)